MATDRTAVEIHCPACRTPLLIPITLAITRRGNGTITTNTETALAHIRTCPGPDTSEEPTP
jgi:hypothetical protein